MELGGGGGPWGEGLIPVITQGGSPSVDQLLASPCLLEWSVDVLSAPAVCCALFLAMSQEPPAAGAVPFLPPFCRETPCCSCYMLHTVRLNSTAVRSAVHSAALQRSSRVVVPTVE